MERGHWGMNMVIEGAFLRVFILQYPLNCVYVGHKRRSRSNAMELRIPNFCVCKLVIGNYGKIVIDENGVNPLPIQVKGFGDMPSGISEYTIIGVFALFLLQISFRPGVSRHHGINFSLKFSNHA